MAVRGICKFRTLLWITKYCHSLSSPDKFQIRKSLVIHHTLKIHQFCRFLSIRAPITGESSEVTVFYQNGLPVVTVPLPSRHERCRFILKPVSSTVGDFLDDLKREDKGIDRVAIYSSDGSKMSSSTCIESLMHSNFSLIINDKEYLVSPPQIGSLSTGSLNDEDIQRLSDMKTLVSHLYVALNIDQHNIAQEKELVVELEKLKVELLPMENLKKQLAEQADRRTNFLCWMGLGLMGVQFGILARLTWWEYSWDIMEPVTYFVTYGTTIAMYAYFVLTRQEYSFPDVKDRQFLMSFYNISRRRKLDIYRYNEIKETIARIEYDLKRLRDPVRLSLPMPHLQQLEFKANIPTN